MRGLGTAVALAGALLAVATADTGQVPGHRPPDPERQTPARAMAEAYVAYVAPAKCPTCGPDIKWNGDGPCWICEPAWWAAYPPKPMQDGPGWSADGLTIEKVVRANLVDGVVL